MTGCSTVGYYRQAIGGQLELWRASKPISRLLADPQTPPSLARQLETVRDIRRFAVEELHLPNNGSYTEYGDLKRDFVVWNVFATPRLSLQPLQSCFPVVGCVSYRGFFSADAAREFAAGLAANDADVYIGGVAAYSTLGWFDDPVLNTFLRLGALRTAEIIFHELVHQKLYISGDTAFNESLAMAVAEIGVERWLARTQGDIDGWRAKQSRDASVHALLLKTREKLSEIYSSNQADDLKHVEKDQMFEELGKRYAELRGQWSGDSSYDYWMTDQMNNAKLASVATYHSHKTAFIGLFELVDKDFVTFYRYAEHMGQLKQDARQRCLATLASSGKLGSNCTP